MILSGFLTRRPDLVVMGDLCASTVNLIGTSASEDAGWSVSGKCRLQKTENQKTKSLAKQILLFSPMCAP